MSDLTALWSGAGSVEEAVRTLRFAQPAWLLLLWATPLLGALLVWLQDRADARLRRFADADLLDQLAPPRRRWRHWLRAAVVCLAIGLISAGLARPQHSPEPREVRGAGAEVVFAIDVSRSMLARDLAPNRLSRTKLWVRDLVATLEGDRVGLVAFAGDSVVKCPLTDDRGFFTLALEELDPSAVTRGGSMIGDAIRVAVEDVFRIDPDEPAPEPGSRDLIIITDGEDQGSFPVAAAEAAGDAGVRIITIGIGSPDQGATIPAGPRDDSVAGALAFQGEVVRSRLDADLLAQIAAATPGGVLLNVGDGAINLDEVYRDLSADRERIAFDRTETVAYAELFQPLLALAAVLLGLEPLLARSTRRRDREDRA
ncbi:MAG: VWA domain-containing protein [Planctomycetota bacterium]